MKNAAAQELGKKGGQTTSPAKTKAARENAKKPRKKWVTAIAYEVTNVEQYKSFGSVIVRGQPPSSVEAADEWFRTMVRENGVGMKDAPEFGFSQLSSTSMRV